MPVPARFVFLAALLFAAPAQARTDAGSADAPPALLRQLLDCRAIADPAARLACYDKQVPEFDKAVAAQDIVVADREEIRKTKRGLFGFAVPVGRLLGMGGDDVKSVETTVSEARATRDGWIIAFADGATWMQTDLREFAMSPKVGNKAVIARGAFGSFTISVDGQQPLKFRRLK